MVEYEEIKLNSKRLIDMYKKPEEGHIKMNSDWHLSKTVPAGTLITLIVLLIGGVITITELRGATSVAADTNKRQWDRIVVLEEKFGKLDSKLVGVSTTTKHTARQVDVLVNHFIKKK